MCPFAVSNDSSTNSAEAGTRKSVSGMVRSKKKERATSALKGGMLAAVAWRDSSTLLQNDVVWGKAALTWGGSAHSIVSSRIATTSKSRILLRCFAYPFRLNHACDWSVLQEQ